MGRDRILILIHKYKLIPMGIFGLVLYIFYRIILRSYRRMGIPARAGAPGLALIFWLIWIIVYFFLIRSIQYAARTGGRSYIADRTRYHLGYLELLAFWEKSNRYKIDESTLPVLDWRKADGIILGHIGSRLIYRPTTSPGNAACFGLPGSGKTPSQIIPTALRFGGTSGKTGSIFAIDIKGDIYHWTRKTRRIKIFDLRNPSKSLRFDLFSGLRKMPLEQRIEFIEQMAYIIIPDANNASDGNYFTEGGRDMMCAVFLYCLYKDPSASFSSCVNYMLEINAFDFISGICSEKKCQEAIQYVASYVGSNERNVAGCWNKSVRTLRQYVTGSLGQLLSYQQGKMISPNDLECGYDCYIEVPEDKLQLYAPIITLICQQYMDAVSRRRDLTDYTNAEKKPPRILFLLDEFAQYSFRFEKIRQFLSTSRSKGASAFLCMQSVASLSKRYGDTGARELLDTIAYISIMSAQDTYSRRYFSDMIGEHAVLKTSSSAKSRWTTSSHTISEQMEPIIKPADFGSLVTDDKVVIYANGKYLIAEKTKCYEA